MVKFYLTLKIIIPLVIMSTCVLAVLISILKLIWDKKFKQNCYDCKHYHTYDIDSCGGGCTKECRLKNRKDRSMIGNNINLVKCKEFEPK